MFGGISFKESLHLQHMMNRIKPSDWYNGRSRTFKKNKRKGK